MPVREFIDPRTGETVRLDVADPDSGSGPDSGSDGNRSNDEWAALRKANTKVSRLERENIMLRAGVPLDSQMAGYFVRGYEGEFTVEAVRAAAIQAGVVQATAQDAPGAAPAAPAAAAGTTGEAAPLTDAQRAQAAAEASARITAAATGAQVHPGEPAEQLLAVAGQGTAAVVAKAREMGLTIAQDGQVLYQTPQSG